MYHFLPLPLPITPARPQKPRILSPSSTTSHSKAVYRYLHPLTLTLPLILPLPLEIIPHQPIHLHLPTSTYSHSVSSSSIHASFNPWPIGERLIFPDCPRIHDTLRFPIRDDPFCDTVWKTRQPSSIILKNFSTHPSIHPSCHPFLVRHNQVQHTVGSLL